MKREYFVLDAQENRLWTDSLGGRYIEPGRLQDKLDIMRKERWDQVAARPGGSPSAYTFAQ